MKRAWILLLFILPFILASASTQLPQQVTPASDRRNDRTQNGQGPSDLGVRADSVDAGQALSGLDQTTGATEFFNNGFGRFRDVEVVQGGTNNGLGPRFMEFRLGGQ